MKLAKAIIALFVLSVLLCGSCMQTVNEDANGKLRIVTTTGMIKDAVENIVGERAEVEALMGPGIDPHLYKPTQSDLMSLTGADVIIYNGLNLEGKMSDILKKMSKSKPVIAFADTLDKTALRADPVYQNAIDPHIWFDVEKWSTCIAYAAIQLSKIDAKNAGAYLSNLQLYRKKLEDLHATAKLTMERIPMERRVLVTTHDAFGYFGEAYDVEVKALQGFSTAAEVGLKDITKMVDLIVERKINAMFVESSVSDKSLKAVVQGCREKGHEVSLGGTLYADAMGEEGTEEGTYIGMFNYNVRLIAEGLR